MAEMLVGRNRGRDKRMGIWMMREIESNCEGIVVAKRWAEWKGKKLGELREL
jgi:hypothetical protein